MNGTVSAITLSPKDLLDGVMSALQEGIVVLDHDGRVMLWNEWMERMSDIPAADALGRNYLDVFGEAVSARAQEAVRWALERQMPSVLSPSLNQLPFPLWKNGKVVEQSVRVLPLGLPQHPPLCLIQVSEVTAVVERERLLRFKATRLRELTLRDSLTGVGNRRRFNEAVESETRRMRRENGTLSLIMVDIDFFKRYNDRHGHQAGDDCLMIVSAAIGAALKRPGDLVCRYGGEEFTVLLPGADRNGAVEVARRIAKEMEIMTGGLGEAVTVSQGVATAKPGSEMTHDDLVAAADAALYLAKARGRNRWCVAGEEGDCA